jgi:hypothetical protein
MDETPTSLLKRLADRVAGLVRRAKAGKALTQQEINWINGALGHEKPERGLPVYETMRSCSGATGIPLAALKSAKARGCPAFRGTRVYLTDFIPWWFRQDGGTGTLDLLTERARETKARADKIELQNSVARRKLIPREDVQHFIVSTYAPVREQVLAMPSVMAPRVNPTDPEHARRHLEEWGDWMLTYCRQHVPEDLAANEED